MSSEITIIAPRSLEESDKLARTLATSALLPDALRNKPQDVLATLMAGAELGLAPMQALRGIQIIQGKPSLSADLMGALVKRRPDICEYLQLVESTPTKATYRTKRKGEPEPTSISFTMEDAKAAQLIGSPMYRKYPAQMLRARCLAAICRAVYPDLCLGLYDSDSGELTNGEPAPEPPPERDVTPPPTAPAAKDVASQIQQQAKARMQIIDVAPGQTEEQAKAAAANGAPPERPQTKLGGAIEGTSSEGRLAKDRIFDACRRMAITGEEAAALIREATGKADSKSLTMADVPKVEAALDALIPPSPPTYPESDENGDVVYREATGEPAEVVPF